MFSKKPPQSNNSYFIGKPDGQDEGPFSLEDVRRKILQGAVTGSTFVRRTDGDHWATAAEFPELAVKDSIAPRGDEGKADALARAMEDAAYGRRIRAGATWFFTIAALSVVNTVLAAIEFPRQLRLGLNVVYIISAIGDFFGYAGHLSAIGVNAFLCFLFLFFGVAGWQRYLIPYIFGLILFTGDSLLCLVAQDWVGAAIRFVVIALMMRGIQAHMEKREKEWNIGLVVAGVVVILLLSGTGFMAMRSLKAHPPAPRQPAETFAAQPADKWPDVVLGSHAEFQGHTSLQGGNVFLIKLWGEDLVAATSRQLIGPNAGVQPKVRLEEINTTTMKWDLYLVAGSTNTFALYGLRSTPDKFDPLGDWLLLNVNPDRLPRVPVKLLTLRRAPAKVGELIYLAIRDANSSKQEMFKGKVTSVSDDVVEGELEKAPDSKALIGAPLLDAKGLVLGVVGGEGGPATAGHGTFLAHTVQEIEWVLPTDNKP